MFSNKPIYGSPKAEMGTAQRGEKHVRALGWRFLPHVNHRGGQLVTTAMRTLMGNDTFIEKRSTRNPYAGVDVSRGARERGWTQEGRW